MTGREQVIPLERWREKTGRESVINDAPNAVNMSLRKARHTYDNVAVIGLTLNEINPLSAIQSPPVPHFQRVHDGGRGRAEESLEVI